MGSLHGNMDQSLPFEIHFYRLTGWNDGRAVGKKLKPTMGALPVARDKIVGCLHLASPCQPRAGHFPALSLSGDTPLAHFWVFFWSALRHLFTRGAGPTRCRTRPGYWRMPPTFGARRGKTILSKRLTCISHDFARFESQGSKSKLVDSVSYLLVLSA